MVKIVLFEKTEPTLELNHELLLIKPRLFVEDSGLNVVVLCADLAAGQIASHCLGGAK